MKRTRKWSYIAQEATRLASLKLSPREIARRLGVDKSSVTRWMASGKLPSTAAPPPVFGTTPPPELSHTTKTPEAWAEAVYRDYALDATDQVLVGLAMEAMRKAQDPSVGVGLRMLAAGRFQTLVRQLALVTKLAAAAPAAAPAKVEPQKRTQMAARTGSRVDPRSVLMVVK